MSDYMVDANTGRDAVRYKSIVVWIHWVTALLVITQIYVGFTFHDMPRGPERGEWFNWHKTIGAVILLLALFRLAVRLMDPPPPYPSDYPKWQRFFGVWNHRIFYILLIALPLTGLAAVSGRAEGGWVPLELGLSLPAIPGIPEENEFGDVHELLVYTTIALLVLHVAAALYNQFLSRSDVADRMPPFRATREG
ncbi:MAG TPA: cytochrome b/b6 domain-containing protein [Sphingomicrobium sp.]|nr:cytochrome b/b6 domain-containing protein [Sphingomicrobium sp.]